MRHSAQAVVAALFIILAPRIASADAAADLAACQRAVADASSKYQAAVTNAVDGCLKKMSVAVIAGGLDTSAAATKSAKRCAAAFRKFENAIKPDRELATVFDTTVGRACNPAVNPDLEHAESDIWQVGATTLAAGIIGSYCNANVAGPATIDSFAGWRDCLRSATECEAREMIATRWPRVLEYLAALKVELAMIPDTADALAALAALDAALEGATEDNRPEIDCARPRGLLVTGAINCGPDHDFLTNVEDILCETNPRTLHDGFFRYGVPFDHTDNGDGTVTDRVTGLTWEKLDYSDGVHDVDSYGDWATMVSAKITQLNASSFAGHSDWRVPNRRELESLVRVGIHAPAIQPEFNNGCTTGCLNTSCSCTASAAYWSSTAYAGDPSHRWIVDFGSGVVTHVDKHSALYRLRAVRGGLVIP
ncbi:MAG TPA: DUF1566 domain-containing protein [Candidatus Limnocylindrales bacterium]|nr:DUF1566 domain-containing protein [Candidatus Limnocylindrales bacterium]